MFFFFNDTATTEIYTLSLHDALPIWGVIPITVSTIETVDKFFEVGEEMAAKICGIPGGSLVVLVAGLPIGVPGGTNLLRVLTIK